MCTLRSILLAALAWSAAAKRVTTQGKLGVALDPFASAMANMYMTPGASNGCTVQGWYGTYLMGPIQAMSVHVGPLTTTINLHAQLSSFDRFKNLNGTHKNSELHELVCSQPSLGEACSFFAPGAVQALCAKEAATAVGRAVQDTAEAVKDTAETAVHATKEFVKENSKDPLAGAFLTASGSNGCSLRGWSGMYTAGPLYLEVDVHTYSTTFTFQNEAAWEKAFPQVKQLSGSHSNEDLADMFCSSPTLGNAFPHLRDGWNFFFSFLGTPTPKKPAKVTQLLLGCQDQQRHACTFWSPGALGSLCPGLLAANAAKAATDTATAGYEAAQKGYTAVKDYFGWK